MKKHCVGKILHGIQEIFFYENNTYKFSYKFIFIPFLSFHRNQNQESKLQQVGDLVTKVLLFVYRESMLYFKGMSNAIDFYKRIFLHVVPALIIVP